MNVDPLDHYCSEIVELHEGGSTIDDPIAGLTSDMKGRWTIGTFDTKKLNNKETPAINEGFGLDMYDSDHIEELEKKGFRWLESEKKWESYGWPSDDGSQVYYAQDHSGDVIFDYTYRTGRWGREPDRRVFGSMDEFIDFITN